MKRSAYLTWLVWLPIGLVGCSLTPANAPMSQDTAVLSTPTSAPTLIPAVPAVTIYYEDNAQVELISPEGTRVLIDVYEPNALSHPATAQDVLLTTHTHPDHLRSDFRASFAGQQLMTKVGEIKLPDVTIQGIASAHNTYGELKPENGSNYIFIVDMGGLRIVHFGDIGQDALTPEQLKVLGKVDIAVMQFDNSYSSMNLANKKGFNLMDQVKPRLIIPTHISLDAAKYAVTKWPSLYSDQAAVTIGPSDLPDETHLLFMGTMAPAFAKALSLPKADW